MPYFFILPIFVLIEVSLLVSSFVVLKFQKYLWAKSYLLGVVLGSTIGFLVANLILWVVSVLPDALAQKYSLPEFVQTVSKFILAFGLLLGPFFASAGGMVFGSLIAVYIVYRKRKTMIK